MSDGETEAAAAEAPEEAESRNPFSNRDYRAWLAASVVTALGVGIQIVAVPLFIRDRVEPDERAAAIAGALMIQELPGVLLTLFGGVLADRMEARLILVRATTVAAVVSGVYVVLAAASVTILWPVFLLSAVIGAVGAFENPARQGVLPRIVTRPQLQNAVIIGNVGFLAASDFIGPALGGLMAGFAGLTAAFSLETALLAAGALLFLLLRGYQPVQEEEQSSIRSDLAEGVRYVLRSPAILGLLMLSAMLGIFFGGPITVTMLLIVEDVLHLGDHWVGILFATFGAGMIVSSGLMTLRPLPRRGLLVALSPVLAAPPLVLFGLSETAWLTVVALLAIGPAGAIFMNLSLALLQENTPQPVMGRVMSIYSLMFAAAMPIGIAQTGLLATLWGAQFSIVASAIAGGVVGFLLLVWSPVRKLP
ncbi:MAG: MFS transporter [Chloroflexi bacterium]|nr:MFS transporter [Chloroflexota bacterium]